MTTLGLLVIGLLLPQMVLALDAETQALERAASYRETFPHTEKIP